MSRHDILSRLARLHELRALADYAALEQQSSALRSEIDDLGAALHRAQQALSADQPAAARACIRFADWTENRRGQLNTQLAALEADRLSARDQAGRALGRRDALDQLSAQDLAARQKARARRDLDQIITEALNRHAPDQDGSS